MKEGHKEEVKKSLKTYDEAFKELKAFIKASKTTEAAENNETKQS